MLWKSVVLEPRVASIVDLCGFAIMKVIQHFKVELQLSWVQVLVKVHQIFLIGAKAAICDFLRREDELMTELMNHKRSTSY
jgi:hypothetical protein